MLGLEHHHQISGSPVQFSEFFPRPFEELTPVSYKWDYIVVYLLDKIFVIELVFKKFSRVSEVFFCYLFFHTHFFMLSASNITKYQ